MENIPDTGPALIVYYHGAIPIDMYYLVARVCLTRDRLIHTVGDRFLFRLPGWGIIGEAMKVIPGTVPICAGILREGNVLAISPGGVYEAQFGNNNYELLWRQRYGFAKVAIDAKAVRKRQWNELSMPIHKQSVILSNQTNSLSFQCSRKICARASDRWAFCAVSLYVSITQRVFLSGLSTVDFQ